MQQTRQVGDEQADHRQHANMVDKQVQTGSRLDRVLKPRRNSQNSMVQSSMLQHSPSMRSMRPILGETTLNMLEVNAAAVSLKHFPVGHLSDLGQIHALALSYTGADWTIMHHSSATAERDQSWKVSTRSKSLFVPLNLHDISNNMQLANTCYSQLMYVMPGNMVTAMCCEQLSKIIKHLQAQLEHQEAVGASLDGQLATALAELHPLQAFEANQQEIIEQVQKWFDITSLQIMRSWQMRCA